MNPIFDTAMLKHHRVDYTPRIDKDCAGRSIIHGRAAFLIIFSVIAFVPIGLISGLAT